MAGQSFQGNTTTNERQYKQIQWERQRNTWGYLYSPVKQKPEWAMNVRCHSFEYSAYNDMEAHNGTPHIWPMNKYYNLQYSHILSRGTLFLKFRFFIWLTWWPFLNICVQRMMYASHNCWWTLQRIAFKLATESVTSVHTSLVVRCNWFCVYFHVQLCNCACFKIVIQKAFV